MALVCWSSSRRVRLNESHGTVALREEKFPDERERETMRLPGTKKDTAVSVGRCGIVHIGVRGQCG